MHSFTECFSTLCDLVTFPNGVSMLARILFVCVSCHTNAPLTGGVKSLLFSTLSFGRFFCWAFLGLMSVLCSCFCLYSNWQTEVLF